MKHIIGFATEFYTLWSYEVVNQYSSNDTVNGVPPAIIGARVYYTYQKNISTDLAKVKTKYPELEIDEELRGRTRSFWKSLKVIPETGIISFGMFAGWRVEVMTDVWQLHRAMNSEPNIRTRILARRRLVEIGDLVLFPHMTEAVYNENDGCQHSWLPTRKRYITISQLSAQLRWFESSKQKAGHWETDGKRISIELREVFSTGFQTQYGMCFIVTMVDSDNRKFTYKGSNPPATSKDDFKKFTGTIKHGSYKDEPQTLLQRIK